MNKIIHHSFLKNLNIETMHFSQRKREREEKGTVPFSSFSLSQKLADKDFIAIYCGPKDLNILGGDINVFIDKETDEIIDVLRGQ